MSTEETVTAIKRTVKTHLEDHFCRPLETVKTYELTELEDSCMADTQGEDGFMAVATIGVIDDELIRRGDRTRSVQ